MKSFHPLIFLKTLLIILLSSFVLQSGYSQISIIGTATPAEDWETDFDLTQDINNPSTWTGQILLQKDLLFKFRANNNWGVNWGSASFPAGSLVFDGDNIMVDSTATYMMNFDSTTLIYEFVIVEIPALTITEDDQVGIGVISPKESAKLEIASTTQGLLPPRMTWQQRDNINNPEAGLLLWCSDCNLYGEIQVYNGIVWTNITGGLASKIPFASTQVGMDIDGEATDDESGSSVSLSADGIRVAIGSGLNDGNGSTSGHVRIYEWDGSSWTQMGGDIDGEALNDYSGGSVSLSADGTRVAIGAQYNSSSGADSGHARVYDWTGTTWTQVGMDIDGEAVSDQSGYSVSLSADGTRLAIGAHQNDGGGSVSGQVRVFEWNGSTWAQMGLDIDGESAEDQSGYSVSLSDDGTRVAIGAPYNDGNGMDSGHARLYDWNGSAWIQIGMDIDGDTTGDFGGWSVSLSGDGNRVAVGAPTNDGNGIWSGHVRVYEWGGTAWIQIGTDIEGEAAGDNSGWSVSLSGDGKRLAIGALSNDGNGSNSGHVRLYEWDGITTWIQLVSDIDGEAADDSSGYSVSLSSDGTHLAVGAPQNDGIGTATGHVRVIK